MFKRISQREGASTPSPVLPVKTSTSLAAMASRFARNEDGSTAMMFGLMVIPSVLMVGLAVDFGRMISVRQQMQVIVDNAALAGARAAQMEGGDDTAVAQTAVRPRPATGPAAEAPVGPDLQPTRV